MRNKTRELAMYVAALANSWATTSTCLLKNLTNELLQKFKNSCFAISNDIAKQRYVALIFVEAIHHYFSIMFKNYIVKPQFTDLFNSL
jgi:hypothetical protein